MASHEIPPRYFDQSNSTMGQNDKANQFTRRRSSNRPFWPPATEEKPPAPFYDPAVIPPAMSNFYITQYEWLQALKAQAHYDLFAALVVAVTLSQWLQALVNDTWQLPGQLTAILLVVVGYGCYTVAYFLWKKFGEIRGFPSRSWYIK